LGNALEDTIRTPCWMAVQAPSWWHQGVKVAVVDLIKSTR
jgi:hypothetical protein